MGTSIRPELSGKSKYTLPKHRYYELKHFCLQYPDWKEEYRNLDGYRSAGYFETRKGLSVSDPTERMAERRVLLLDRMKLVEQSAIDADSELSNYILRAVTEGLSYEALRVQLMIPCCRDVYYDRYRRFFWLLNIVRR